MFEAADVNVDRQCQHRLILLAMPKGLAVDLVDLSVPIESSAELRVTYGAVVL